MAETRLKSKNFMAGVASNTPDRISYSCGLTLNMGNFESVRLDIGMSSDVRASESADDTLVRITSFVEQRLDELSKQIKK